MAVIPRPAARGWPLRCALLVVVAVLSSRAGAFAHFSGGASATHTISSAALSPAANPAASTSCGPFLSLSAKVNLSWTATPSTFASGYKVERWRGSVLELPSATVTPRTTTVLTQTGLATGTTYTWKVYSYVQGWTSSVVTVSATTPGLCL